MSKYVIRCPECGANKHSIRVIIEGADHRTVDCDGTEARLYSGERLFFQSDDVSDLYQCDECAYESYSDTDFLMEVDDDGNPLSTNDAQD